ncbi:tyrosine-protein phosphatase [Novosphingobium flavum]|uniref:Tyrosine-protein phosphatase n=2 Tax=Novosphingobium flavum TaxID=1778672 RepID=A0A7X1FUP9_9SPHN|nr:tyrosine-protein phosphatase [Novosphingobium flavum]
MFARRRVAFALLAAGSLTAAPALAAPPAEPMVQRRGEALVVTWQSRGPVDVFVADRADATLKSARLVAARDADGKAEIAGTGTSRSYVLLRDVRTGDVAAVAERVIPLEAGSNFRDIGGYPAANGRHVKWGMIYRSGGTPLITAADQERIRALGLANMIDLRSDEERVLAPSRVDGVPYTAVGYSMGKLGVAGGMEATYRNLPAMMAPQLRQIFAKLLRQEAPLAYNCSAGQDRTGFATAVILSALGTDYAAIVTDYHLSTRYRRPEFEMPRIDPAQHAGDPVAAMFAHYQGDPRYSTPPPLKTADGQPFLDFAYAEIKDRWGGVDGYLRAEIGLSPQDIARLRQLYTS